MAPTQEDVDRYLKNALVKDLRIQCRARGISPAGGKDTLASTLKEHMLTTHDYTIRAEDGTTSTIGATCAAGHSTADVSSGTAKNNYARPGGQNVGNFITDRNSSRVLAPPGGSSQITFG